MRLKNQKLIMKNIRKKQKKMLKNKKKKKNNIKNQKLISESGLTLAFNIIFAELISKQI